MRARRARVPLGIPGTIGGALRMNAGAYGSDLSHVLVSARRSIDPQGRLHVSPAPRWASPIATAKPAGGLDLHLRRRLRGHAGRPWPSSARMAEIRMRARGSQPVRSPHRRLHLRQSAGRKAWELVDKAGCRGLTHRRRQVSEKHCNFLINTGEATPPTSSAGRGGAAPRAGADRRAARLGNQAYRRAGGESGPMTRVAVLSMKAAGRPSVVSLVSGEACARGLRDGGHEEVEYDGEARPARLVDFLRPASGGARTWSSTPCMVATARTAASRACSRSCAMPYTHSGVLASAIAMDKPLARLHLRLARACASPEGRLIERRSSSPPAIPCRAPMS
jgi:hypothetical protein